MKRNPGSSRRRRSDSSNDTRSVKNVFFTLRRQSCRSSLAHFLVAKVDLFEAYFARIRIISIISDKMLDDMNHGYRLPSCRGPASSQLTTTKTIHISRSRLDVRNWWRLAKI